MSNKKKTVRRCDDPMEVGLARYQKESQLLPSWLVVHGAKLVLGAFFMVVVVPLLIFRDSIFGGTVPSDRNVELVVVQGPSIVWEPGGTNVVRSVTALIGNQSFQEAQAVTIVANVAERQYPLEGADVIPSGESREYHRELMVPHNPNMPIHIELQCKNCLQTP
jgi:hypothetical protein